MFPDRDAVPMAEVCFLLDPSSVQIDAVATAQVHQGHAGGSNAQESVPPRDHRVVDRKLTLLTPPDDELTWEQLDVMCEVSQPKVLHPPTLLQTNERFEPFDAGHEESVVGAIFRSFFAEHRKIITKRRPAAANTPQNSVQLIDNGLRE